MLNTKRLLLFNVRRILFCLGLLLSFALPAQAEVATASLKRLVDRSKLIFIGQITEVIQVDEIRVAKVRSDKILKGRFKGNILYYRASPLGMCNSDGGEEGEAGIYFFESLKPREYRWVDNKITDVLALAWAGQGRLVVHKIDQGNYVYTSEYGRKYVYPSKVKVSWLPQREGQNQGIIKMEDIVFFISTRIKGQR